MKKKKKDAVMTAIFGGVGKVMSGIVDGLSDQNVLCGTYADGTPRSFIDALRGDYISPEKKKKILKKQCKKKKDKKKKDKFEKTLKKIQKEKKKLLKNKNKLFR